MDVTVRFMQLDDEYSQSQAIHTPIQKGACAVMQCCLLTATTGTRAEEEQHMCEWPHENKSSRCMYRCMHRSLYCTKVPYMESLFTQRPYLQCLQADISGIQDQVLSIWMGESWNLKNCLANSQLNNIFQISNESWHELSHKCHFFMLK